MTNSILVLAAGVAVMALTAIWLARRAARSPKVAEFQEMVRAIQAHLERLATERNQVVAILEGLSEGVIAVDAHGRMLLANSTAGLLLGGQADGWVGQNIYEAVRHHDVHELVRQVLAEGRPAAKEIELFHPLARCLRVHGVPCQPGRPASGELSAVLVIQDITEHVRYERLRREFVANVSHELKSPLTSIRGLTETLLDGALDDAASRRRFVQLIDEDAKRLTRLIDDLLALSQIESQAVPLRRVPVELRPLVESVVASLQAPLQQRRVAVDLELPDGLTVSADPDRLRQVLVNLLDNAVKYNREGGRITVSAAPSGAGLTVTVRDTGIGIPAEDLPRIFERFYRVDKARSREQGGTGLGLSIVKHIIDAHGGTVGVDSRASHGSAFSFTLPHTLPEAS